MPLSVVILAAGQGKRMNSDLPKALQALAGRPLLKHVIDTVRILDPDTIYVVYGHGGAQVQEALQQEPVDWVLQSQQLGTGHAVMQAMPLIPDSHTVLVLYGDVPLIRTGSIKHLLEAAHDGALALLSVKLEDPTGYGRVIRDKAGQVVAVAEHRDATPAQLQLKEINTGLLAAPAGALRRWLLELTSNNTQREFYLTDIVEIAVRAKAAVRGIVADNPAEVQGVNDKLELAEAESAYRREQALALLRAGATLADPARIDIRGKVTVGRDVFIDVNAVLIGEVHLGDGVTIGPNCVITNCRIGAGTQVFANCVLQDSAVGRHCNIGPFARLRPGALLHDEVHLGNFVEVKLSQIGAGSKANHLTYIGDAQVGAGVNVGAGTIFCNYDGANKWPTFVGDGAFIGSGSMLVGPVRIGASATIGAGSTITYSTPDGTLTLERAQQSSIEGWTRPVKLTEPERAAIIAKKTETPKK